LILNLFLLNKLIAYMGQQGDRTNLIDIEAGQVWTLRQVISLMTFVGTFSGLLLIMVRYCGYFVTGDAFYLYETLCDNTFLCRDYGYTSLNPLVLAVVMGLR
jgi:hypothetical protein